MSLSDNRPIFLIGYMCSGKTTLGQSVAAAAGLPFVDLDDMIERKEGMTVSQIFERYGEQKFRELERDVLHSCTGKMIVACGGGTPCHYDNMDWMNVNGLTIKLESSEDRLLERLRQGALKRPLLTGKSDDELIAFVNKAMSERKEWYDMAAVTFDSTRLETPQEVAETTSVFIDSYLNHDI